MYYYIHFYMLKCYNRIRVRRFDLWIEGTLKEENSYFLF
jgi:hypothetical protein